MRAGLDSQARNYGREAPRFGEKRDTGEFGCGGQHVATAIYHRTTEILVEEALLRHFPTDNLAHAAGALAWIQLFIVSRLRVEG